MGKLLGKLTGKMAVGHAVLPADTPAAVAIAGQAAVGTAVAIAGQADSPVQGHRLEKPIGECRLEKLVVRQAASADRLVASSAAELVDRSFA